MELSLTVDLQTLLMRAQGGKSCDARRVFRPSLFYVLLEDPFGVWCEYHAPRSENFDETTPYDKHRMEQGNQWEDEFVRRQFPNAFVVTAPWGQEALRQTFHAMLRGVPAIHGAALWLLQEDVYGKADVLIRCDDHPSDLGSFHYRVKEVKNASKVKKHHQLQAACYNWILGKLQGYTPVSFAVVLKEGEGEQTIKFAAAVPELKACLSTWRDIRDGKVPLQPLAYDSTKSPWRRFANRLIRERNDVSLLPGVGGEIAARWRADGVVGLDDVLAKGPEGNRGRPCQVDCYYHALAYQTGRPVFRPGDSAKIERRARQVHFDVEDITILDGKLVNRPHTYMVGVATPDGQTTIWTAHGQEDEARMWSDFLDWLGDPRDVALYCWTKYEAVRLKKAAETHGNLAKRLLAAERALIDLKEQVKHRPYFPVPSYSIKCVAPICGFNWSQDDVDGMSAQLLYLNWLQSGDDSLIRKVEQYNREDVLAMVAVDRFVTGLCG